MKSFVPDQAQGIPSVERDDGDGRQPIIEIRDLRKTYRSAGHELTVLRDINLTLFAGDTCAIIGPSGSGKTTLLGLCAGLDDATAGSVRLEGQPLEALDQDARAALRNRLVGFVFQNFQLIPTLTAIDTGVPDPVTATVDTAGQVWFGQTGGGNKVVRISGDLSGAPTVSVFSTPVTNPAWPVVDRNGNVWFGSFDPTTRLIVRVSGDLTATPTITAFDTGVPNPVTAVRVAGVNLLRKQDAGTFVINGANFVAATSTVPAAWTLDVGTFAIDGGEVQLARQPETPASTFGGPSGARLRARRASRASGSRERP
jgi:putative ABC transport system ATP-binding protein